MDRFWGANMILSTGFHKVQKLRAFLAQIEGFYKEFADIYSSSHLGNGHSTLRVRGNACPTPIRRWTGVPSVRAAARSACPNVLN